MMKGFFDVIAACSAAIVFSPFLLELFQLILKNPGAAALFTKVHPSLNDKLFKMVK